MRVKLKEIGEIVTGNTPSKQNKEYYSHNDILFVKPDVLEQNTVNLINNSNEFLSNSAKCKCRIAPKNSVLVTCIGIIGKIGIVKCEESAFNQQINAIICNKKIDYEYLAYNLLYNKYNLSKIANAPVVPLINKTDFSNFEINIVNDVKVQKQYVYKLNILQGIIKKYKGELEKLDTLVKARFVEMFGDVNNNSKKWVVEKLSDLCEITRGGSPRPISSYLGGDVPWIKISDASKDDTIYINSTKEHIIEEGINKSRLVKKGSLIFANCGVSLGFCRIINIDGCIHDGWLAFSNVDKRVNKVFLLHTINQLTNYFRSIAPGGTQPNLNTEIMGNYKQIIPPIELQENYINFTEEVDKLKFD